LPCEKELLKNYLTENQTIKPRNCNLFTLQVPIVTFINMYSHVLYQMIEGTIFIDSKGRGSIHIPSSMIKKYNLKKGEKVGIDDEDGLIIIDLRR